MARTTRALARAALAAALAGAAVTTVAPPAGAADVNGQIVALTPTNNLITFDADNAATTLRNVAVTGIASGESLLGIDVRPATGELYAVGSTSRLYRVSPVSGAATAVGTGPFSPALNGTAVGFDFNPTVDRIRLITADEQNLRLHPDTGAVAAVDTPLAYATGDPGAGTTDLRASAAAYTNNRANATATTLFDIDTGRDVLVTQVPPNAGTLNTVGPLGVDAADVNGFDIGPDGTAFAGLTTSAGTRLYTINLSTGAASPRAFLSDGVRGLAVLPVVDHGYRTVTSTGQVDHFGSARPFVGAPSFTPARPIVGIAHDPRGSGYWLVGDDGGVFAVGGADFYGGTGGLRLNSPVVGLAPTPTGKGYWLVAADGGVFAYGDAKFFGSTGSLQLNKPVVGMASTPTGLGYWLVASDGGIFAYGAAPFFGSAGSLRLVAPITGMDATSRGDGYWLVAADGGIFSYGKAPFHGAPNRPAGSPRVVGISSL